MDYEYKVTTNGRGVMAACMALEKPFHITRVAFGSGKVTEGVNLADVHKLLEYVSDGAVASRRHQDDRFELTVQYANSVHPGVKTFLLSEFLVYAENPETGKETDLLYGTMGDYRQPVPAYNPAYPPSVFNFPLTLILSSEINAYVSAPAGLATWSDLNLLIDSLAVRRMDMTIPAAGWVRDGTGRYPFRRDVSVTTATESMIPSLTVLQAGENAAIACGLCPRAQTLDGAVRVFAASVPTADIPVSLTLQGDASGYLPSSTSSVRAGAGLKMAQDGTISVDTATDEEVQEMLAAALASDNK